MLRDDCTDAEVLATLRALSTRFYMHCFAAGLGTHAHAFLEFNGVHNEYINMLGDAVLKGASVRTLNQHGEAAPTPIAVYRMRYLGEKLRCIFAPFIDHDPIARAELQRAIFGDAEP